MGGGEGFSVFGVQIPKFSDFPTGLIPVEFGFCTTRHGFKMATGAVQKPFTTGVNPVGENSY